MKKMLARTQSKKKKSLKQITHSAVLSDVSHDFRCSFQNGINGSGLQKAGDESLQKPASCTGSCKKWKRNVSKIIHVPYTIANSLPIAWGG